MSERLYVLAFDHRHSLMTSFFAVEGEPTSEQVERAREVKRVIWEGLLAALDQRVPRENAGALVDATYGADVIAAAPDLGVKVAVPVEASGRQELAFEHPDWRERLDAIDPAWAKVLVRYNPEGDEATNEHQRARLQELHEHCVRTGRAFMFELLVPPEPHQLLQLGGDRARYDTAVRPGLMARAIGELRAAGVTPDVWKIEGLEDRADCEAIAAVAQAPCIVLGRGADNEAVDRWLRAAAAVPGFVGFAIGRSIWWGALRLFFDDKRRPRGRAAAVERIATNFRRFVDVYEAEA